MTSNDPTYLLALSIAIIAGSQVIVQKYLLNNGINWKAMMVVNAFFFFFFGLFFTYYYRNDVFPQVKRFSLKTFLILGFTILIATFISSILNYKLLERNNAYIVSGLTLAAPIFTLLFAKLFLQENVSCKGVLGVLVMLFGSWLVIQAKKEADAK